MDHVILDMSDSRVQSPHLCLQPPWFLLSMRLAASSATATKPGTRQRFYSPSWMSGWGVREPVVGDPCHYYHLVRGMAWLAPPLVELWPQPPPAGGPAVRLEYMNMNIIVMVKHLCMTEYGSIEMRYRMATEGRGTYCLHHAEWEKAQLCCERKLCLVCLVAFSNFYSWTELEKCKLCMCLLVNYIDYTTRKEINNSLDPHSYWRQSYSCYVSVLLWKVGYVFLSVRVAHGEEI